MAMDLTKGSMREKIEILTSQAAVTHALDFVEKTKQEVKEQFIKSMQQIVKQDKFESAPINYAVEDPEIQSYTTAATTGQAYINLKLGEPEKEGWTIKEHI
jgi:hypothetical protein